MNEHDDDIEPEVDESGEFEEEEFPILTDEDEEIDAGTEQGVPPVPPDTDSDESEI